ncbi:activating signal cointegrator complex subunit 2 [Geosmithia morbida]|uniref:Activating signal cointegrator complex subunit 2 n=1 Tax=Geosmithia morbida TaxID=1094350 RepID=A0A9P4Z2D1_9HYPO|nr:activating signal cointegrator complex subunit 2 [Geosmithia morbida]KAF4126176.1 activating signal cointegrator complex subunit 2 [Geosmithia morbida]
MTSLPPFAPFPEASWRQHLDSNEWNSLLEAWLLLSQVCLTLSDKELKKKLASDESMFAFLVSLMNETAESGPSCLGSHSASLLSAAFQLCSRLFVLQTSPALVDAEFLCNLARVYPKKHAAALVSKLFASAHGPAAESSLTAVKKLLIPHLEAGVKGNLILVEKRLVHLNHLLHISPDACTLLLAGSDFFDGLVVSFRVTNPPLRKIIVTTVYLCLVGLTEAEPPKWAMLNDELYTLRTAADTHRAGLLNVNDSLVSELVTSTPVLKILMRRAESASVATDNFKNRITALEAYKKGPMVRPKRLAKRKVDKGKGKQTVRKVHKGIHVHRMSQITQIQDLFPDLGSAFISKCLDEYGEDVEQVVANLLAETLPPHLASADRSEPLSSNDSPETHFASHSTPPQVPAQLPTRRNIYDNDEFDDLSVDMSKVSFGKNHDKTSREVESTAPDKAAILTALAAFDLDDDERDDTYDAADVGGTVDSSNQEADGVSSGNEEILYRAYAVDERLFGRDAGTRRGQYRAKLREETGMTDEAIEGWAVMLSRNPQQKRRLEGKYAFSGEQAKLERTSWTANTDDDGVPGPSHNDRGRGGRLRGGRGRGQGQGRGGRGGGNVAGPTGEKGTETARKNKESNKRSRANHDRRDARAKKMGRGGLPG